MTRKQNDDDDAEVGAVAQRQHVSVAPAEHDSAAEAADGVVAVLTAANIPGELRHGLIHKDWPVMIPVGGRRPGLLRRLFRPRVKSFDGIGPFYERLYRRTSTGEKRCRFRRPDSSRAARTRRSYLSQFVRGYVRGLRPSNRRRRWRVDCAFSATTL